MNRRPRRLAWINQLKQNIHNLRMRCPIGIRSIDDEYDEKLKRLEALLEEETSRDGSCETNQFTMKERAYETQPKHSAKRVSATAVQYKESDHAKRK